MTLAIAVALTILAALTSFVVTLLIIWRENRKAIPPENTNEQGEF